MIPIGVNMSRTDKHVPYWVAANNLMAETRHRHYEFGRKVEIRSAVRDENNKPVFERIPLMRGSQYILDNPWVIWFAGIFYVHKERILREARHHVAMGRPYQSIQVGWTERVVTRVSSTYTMFDYCTEGMPRTGKQSIDRRMPCTPEVPWSYERTMFGRGSQYGEFANMEESSVRAESRDTLKNAANHYNTHGWDEYLEDDILHLTRPHRHSGRWYLW